MERLVRSPDIHGVIEKRGRAPQPVGFALKHLDHLIGGHVKSAHVVGIDKKDPAELPTSGNVAGAGNGKRSAGSQIDILGVHIVVIVGLEVVPHGQGVTAGDELQEALPIISCGKITSASACVRGAVGSDQVDIIRRVRNKPLPSHPNCPLSAIGRVVEYLDLLQGFRVVSQHPPVVGRVVLMRTERQVYDSIHQRDGWPLELLLCGKGHDSVVAVRCRSTNGCCNLYRAAEFFRAGGYIECMQTVYLYAVLISFGGCVKGAAARVDHRRADNADLNLNVFRGDGPAWNGSSEGNLPVLCPRIRIERIHAIVCGRDIKNVVRSLTWNRNAGSIQGLRVYKTIHRQRKSLAERTLVHVTCGKDRLVRIRAVPGQVIVLREHVDRLAQTWLQKQHHRKGNG